MVSHNEVSVGKANGHSGAQKQRARKSAKSRKTSLKTPAHKTPKSLAHEPGGTDIVPVMKLKAIDLVGAEDKRMTKSGSSKGGSKDDKTDVLHMPPPETKPDGTASGEDLVSDPELLELLQQLSETIDTANTVLEAAAPDGGTHASAVGEALTAQGVQGGGEQADRPAPAPTPEPPLPEEDLPLAAAAMAEKNGQAPLEPKTRFGFGLFLNAALSGLILTAGAAWIVHTNPWLLDRTSASNSDSVEVAAPIDDGKDQSSLAKPEPAEVAAQKPATAGSAIVASLAPPSAEPVPMESTALEQEKLKANENIAPLHTRAGKDVALNIALSPVQESSETSVMVQGVPKDSKLSHGKDLGSGNWLLNKSQLSDVKLQTGSTLQPGEHVIEFIVVKSDGSVPETRKVTVMVEAPAADNPASQSGTVPVAAASTTSVARQTEARQVTAAEQQAPLPALSPAEVKALLTRGTNLLEEGDVAGARLLLEYAAQRGSKEAMVKLAQSYDPDHLLKLAVHGVQPDAELSAHWYRRAEATQ